MNPWMQEREVFGDKGFKIFRILYAMPLATRPQYDKLLE